MMQRKRRLRSLAVPALAAGLFVAAPGLRAADVPTGPAETPGTSSAPAAIVKPARPYWLELTLAQRQALAPLADDWERLDLQTKKKWVEIANRYPKMNPDEQERSQQRMREWAMLTPEQRRVARDVSLSEGTVRNHLSSAIGKTMARNRADAVRIADEYGWL